MASSDALEKAYAAIARLRQQGLSQLSVDAVADVAGLARSSFYQKDDDDWAEVRKVIRGKASPRVKLVEIEVSETRKVTSRLSSVLERVAKLEAALADTNKFANDVYHKLIDQVQYYFAKAEESPKKLEQSRKQINELKQARHDLQVAQNEISMLKKERLLPNVVPHRTVKKTVELPSTLDLPNLFSEFLNEFDRLFPDEGSIKALGQIYIVCGLPLCGKTRWINRHEPSRAGISLYVEGTNETSAIRSFLVGRLRKRTSSEITCVWIAGDPDTCKKRCRATHQGIAHVDVESEIQRVSSESQTVSILEDFDVILPVRG